MKNVIEARLTVPHVAAALMKTSHSCCGSVWKSRFVISCAPPRTEEKHCSPDVAFWLSGAEFKTKSTCGGRKKKKPHNDEEPRTPGTWWRLTFSSIKRRKEKKRFPGGSAAQLRRWCAAGIWECQWTERRCDLSGGNARHAARRLLMLRRVIVRQI